MKDPIKVLHESMKDNDEVLRGLSGKVFYVDVDNLVSFVKELHWILPRRVALIEDVKKNGVLDPLEVIPMADGKYEIWDGSHRWFLAKQYGIKTVPCILHQRE